MEGIKSTVWAMSANRCAMSRSEDSLGCYRPDFDRETCADGPSDRTLRIDSFSDHQGSPEPRSSFRKFPKSSIYHQCNHVLGRSKYTVFCSAVSPASINTRKDLWAGENSGCECLKGGTILKSQGENARGIASQGRPLDCSSVRSPLIPYANKIIGQLLDHSRRVAWLDILRVVGDENRLGGLGYYQAFFALWFRLRVSAEGIERLRYDNQKRAARDSARSGHGSFAAPFCRTHSCPPLGPSCTFRYRCGNHSSRSF